MTIKEQRILFGSDLRNACIAQDWYSCGSNEQYSALLRKADTMLDVTTNDLQELAADIYGHSDRYLFIGMTDAEAIAYIMHIVAGKCLHMFEIIE